MFYSRKYMSHNVHRTLLQPIMSGRNVLLQVATTTAALPNRDNYTTLGVGKGSLQKATIGEISGFFLFNCTQKHLIN